MTDPTERLSARRMMELSAEAVALLTSPGDDLLIELLTRARLRAQDALIGLQTVDPEQPAAIRTLQNEVRIYLDLLEHLKAVIVEGFEKEREFHESTRDEAREFALDEEELALLGISEQRAPE